MKVFLAFVQATAASSSACMRAYVLFRTQRDRAYFTVWCKSVLPRHSVLATLRRRSLLQLATRLCLNDGGNSLQCAASRSHYESQSTWYVPEKCHGKAHDRTHRRTQKGQQVGRQAGTMMNMPQARGRTSNFKWIWSRNEVGVYRVPRAA